MKALLARGVRSTVPVASSARTESNCCQGQHHRGPALVSAHYDTRKRWAYAEFVAGLRSLSNLVNET